MINQLNKTEMEKIITLFSSQIDDLNNSSCKTSSDAQIAEWAKKYTLEVKEGDGCKIEYLVENNKPVAALLTEEGETERLDKDNMLFSFNDFQGFLSN